jgi:hypothetical protein
MSSPLNRGKQRLAGLERSTKPFRRSGESVGRIVMWAGGWVGCPLDHVKFFQPGYDGRKQTKSAASHRFGSSGSIRPCFPLIYARAEQGFPR